MPHAMLIWSQILPRTNWKFSEKTDLIEICRRRINCTMGLYMIYRGVVISNILIKNQLSKFISNDGVHLTSLGNNVCLNTLKEEFEDTKGEIRIRKSKKNRQHNGQRKKYMCNDQQNTYKTKDRVTRTPLKTGDDLRCSGRVSSSCSTSDTRRVNLVTYTVISHKRGKDREVFTSGTYPWSFVTQIFHNGQPGRGGDRKMFEVMTFLFSIIYIKTPNFT